MRTLGQIHADLEQLHIRHDLLEEEVAAVKAAARAARTFECVAARIVDAVVRPVGLLGPKAWNDAHQAVINILRSETP